MAGRWQGCAAGLQAGCGGQVARMRSRQAVGGRWGEVRLGELGWDWGWGWGGGMGEPPFLTAEGKGGQLKGGWEGRGRGGGRVEGGNGEGQHVPGR